MNHSLFFRSAESGSLITLTWKDGLVFKNYNGRIAGRRWEMTQPPASADSFEHWCRRELKLSANWHVRHVTGVQDHGGQQ